MRIYAHAKRIYAETKFLMPYISVELDQESDALLQALASKERRSKREQLAFSAISHARSILPDFKFEPAKPSKKKGAK